MGKMISIPVDEYEALRAARDDLDELLAYDHAKAALVRGDEELIPSDVVRKLLEGESPLRVWRDHRGMTQQALAAISKVNRVQIANIESGAASGSVATLGKLAQALGILMDDLV